MTKKVIHFESKSGLIYDLQIVYTRFNIKFECFNVIQWASGTIDRADHSMKQKQVSCYKLKLCKSKAVAGISQQLRLHLIKNKLISL